MITKAFGETSFVAPNNFDSACIHNYHGHHSYRTTLVKSTLTGFKKPTIVWKFNQPSIIVPAGMSGVADLRLHRPSPLIISSELTSDSVLADISVTSPLQV